MLAMSQPIRTVRGCVLVICNSFVNTPAERAISMSDAQAMKMLWGDSLGCDSFPIEEGAGYTDFIVHHDVEARDMLDLLTNFAHYQSRIDYSYIAVVISSHGGLVAESWVKEWDPMTRDVGHACTDGTQVYENYKTYGVLKRAGNFDDEKMVEVIFGNDFRPIDERKIKELFYSGASTAWQNVPKFFILDYCRVDTVDRGVVRIPPPTTFKAMGFTLQSQCSKQTMKTAELLNPSISDVLIVYPTSYRANQHPAFQGLLLSTIAEVFMNCSRQMHVVDMLTTVNRVMKKKAMAMGSGPLQQELTIYESTLEENFYFCDQAKLTTD